MVIRGASVAHLAHTPSARRTTIRRVQDRSVSARAHAPGSVAYEEHLRRRARSVATQLPNIDFRGLELDDVADTLARIEQRLDTSAARTRERPSP